MIWSNKGLQTLIWNWIPLLGKSQLGLHAMLSSNLSHRSHLQQQAINHGNTNLNFNFNISNELSIWCIKVMWALYGHSSFNWPPIFEWYVVRVAVKNGHQKDMCYDDLKLCGQNLNTILGSIGNTNWEVLWDRSTRKRVFTMGPLITFASPLPFWNLKWQSTWFTITSWLRQFSSWSNCQNYLWIRKCPQ